jgi:hypothetical protein
MSDFTNSKIAAIDDGLRELEPCLAEFGRAHGFALTRSHEGSFHVPRRWLHRASAGRGLLTVVSLLVAFCACTSPRRTATYIPKDLDDAHRELVKMLPATEIEHIRAMTNQDQMIEYHFDVGMGLRNQWGLWHESRLASYFEKLGVEHPDEMSGVILATFWCKLHGKRYNLREMIGDPKERQEYWRSMEDPKEGSPRDGAVIVWLITKPGAKFHVHLGISTSDGSYWRYEYRSGRGIEQAKEEDRKDLDDLKETWKQLGTKLEDFTKQVKGLAPSSASEPSFHSSHD